MLTITINTENAAFHELGDFSKKEECKRILNDIVRRIDNEYTKGKCIDINGNVVGSWEMD